MNAIRRELRFLREAAESDPEPLWKAVLGLLIVVTAVIGWTFVFAALSPP